MRDFKVKDFVGAGQYLIRNDKPANQYTDPGFMSTIMFKVGYDHNSEKLGTGKQITCKISMADGWVQKGHFITDEKTGESKHVLWQGKEALVEYLNNPDLSQEYRFATQQEAILVILYQTSRFKSK